MEIVAVLNERVVETFFQQLLLLLLHFCLTFNFIDFLINKDANLHVKIEV